MNNEKPATLKPLRDDVYVELLDAPVSSIIFQPDYEYEPKMPVRGKVLAVGPGRLNKHGVRVLPAVLPGDTIQFHFGALHKISRTHGIVEGPHVQLVFE